MRNRFQINASALQRPAPRMPRRFRNRGWALLGAGLACSWAGLAGAQTLRLGPFDMTLAGRVDFAYDSNVDGSYPAEARDDVVQDDFYWMPSLTLQSSSVAMQPSTTMSLSSGIAYQDYLRRNELDTMLYFAGVNIQRSHPRLTLSGVGRIDYSVDSMEDQYRPGGITRDPTLTQTANGAAVWNYRRLSLNAGANFTRERHDFEEYQIADKDETSYQAGARFAAFSWGSLFYTWERTMTTMIMTGEETDDTSESFGVSGAIPLELLRRPQVTYSFGYSREQKVTEDSTDDTGWEMTHTVTVSDQIEFSKTTRLTGTASWVNDVTPDDEDQITFQYNLNLSQQLGPRAQHALTFTHEPRPTFGSTVDTETRTYGYSLGIRDVFVYGLTFSYGVTYDESTPLTRGSLTEKTLSHNTGLSHSRQFSRKLSRTLSYQYTWEDSNFQSGDPMEKHLVVYGLSYVF